MASRMFANASLTKQLTKWGLKEDKAEIIPIVAITGMFCAAGAYMGWKGWDEKEDKMRDKIVAETKARQKSI